MLYALLESEGGDNKKRVRNCGGNFNLKETKGGLKQ